MRNFMHFFHIILEHAAKPPASRLSGGRDMMALMAVGFSFRRQEVRNTLIAENLGRFTCSAAECFLGESLFLHDDFILLLRHLLPSPPRANFNNLQAQITIS